MLTARRCKCKLLVVIAVASSVFIFLQLCCLNDSTFNRESPLAREEAKLVEPTTATAMLRAVVTVKRQPKRKRQPKQHYELDVASSGEQSVRHMLPFFFHDRQSFFNLTLVRDDQAEATYQRQAHSTSSFKLPRGADQRQAHRYAADAHSRFKCLNSNVYFTHTHTHTHMLIRHSSFIHVHILI